MTCATASRRRSTLIELDPNDVRSVIKLVTHHSQQRFATPLVISLAEAAVPPYEYTSNGNPGDPQVVPWHRIIHADGVPVGFVMMEEPTETDPEPYLWRLLIDRMHQRRGIGKRVVEMLTRYRCRGLGELVRLNRYIWLRASS